MIKLKLNIPTQKPSVSSPRPIADSLHEFPSPPSGFPVPPAKRSHQRAQSHHLMPRIRVKSASMSNKIRLKTTQKSGFGYDSEAEDKELDPHLEEQFILRMKPGSSDYAYLKQVTEDRGVPEMSIKFKDQRRAVVRIRETLYSAKLMDLPTIIESSKTLNRKALYKTADISQILIIGDPISHEDTVFTYPLGKHSDYSFPHGVTPPLRNVRKRRFRKRISNRTIETIENELDRLLKADAEAISTSFEIVDPRSTRDNSLAPNPSDAGSPLAQRMDIYSEEEDDDAGFDDFAGELEQEMMEIESGSSMVAHTPAGADTTRQGSVESDSEGGGLYGDGDDGDDEEEEEEESEETKKRQAQMKLIREEIAELEAAVETKKAQAEGTTNPIMRGRLMEVVRDLEREVGQKRLQLDDDEDQE